MSVALDVVHYEGKDSVFGYGARALVHEHLGSRASVDKTAVFPRNLS